MTRKETLECAELSAQAFANYEYFTHFFPDLSERLRFLRAVLRSEYRATRHRACFLVGRHEGQIVAVVDLFPPNWRKPHDLVYFMYGWGKVMLLPNQQRVKQWLSMDEEAGRYCHSLIGDGTWYVNAFTISPTCQGKGFGRRMMIEGVLPYIKSQGGTRLCLFTNSEGNYNFYHRLGFETLNYHEIACPTTTMGSWDLAKML